MAAQLSIGYLHDGQHLTSMDKSNLSPFDTEGAKIVLVVIEERRVPNVFHGPVCHSQTRSNHGVLIGNACIVQPCLSPLTELPVIIPRIVRQGTVEMSRCHGQYNSILAAKTSDLLSIQIGFVSDLEPKEIIANYTLSMFHNLQVYIDCIVEWNSHVPFHIGKGRDVGHQI